MPQLCPISGGGVSKPACVAETFRGFLPDLTRIARVVFWNRFYSARLDQAQYRLQKGSDAPR